MTFDTSEYLRQKAEDEAWSARYERGKSKSKPLRWLDKEGNR